MDVRLLDQCNHLAAYCPANRDAGSATQIIPKIVDEVKQLNQFFRTPQYYYPRPDPDIGPWLKWGFRYIPGLLKAFRYYLFIRLETTFDQFYTTASAEKAREISRQKSLAYIHKRAPEKYWSIMTPNYSVGCKRRIFDPGYVPTLKRDNMHLTNDPIVKLEGKEVITKSGQHFACDVLIAANGFAPFFFNQPLVGRDGATLSAHWSQFGGVEAYKTTALSDFPNYFMIFGPNAATGHTSAVYAIENTIDLVLKVVKPILKDDTASAVEVKYDAEKNWVETLQGALKQRVWADNCHTFYVDQKTGWNYATYPWSSYHMWFVNRFPIMSDWTYARSDQQKKTKVRRQVANAAFGIISAGVGAAAVWYTYMDRRT